jgi:hypothetical protein
VFLFCYDLLRPIAKVFLFTFINKNKKEGEENEKEENNYWFFDIGGIDCCDGSSLDKFQGKTC